MYQSKITDSEFSSFRMFIYDHAGIHLRNDKKSLVTARLSKRLRHYSLETFQEYFDLVIASPNNGERQIVIDLLTTNETYFFREPKHFDFMEKEILVNWNKDKTFKVWSAASSTGEEAYSIAMLLDDKLGHRHWEIFGSDISNSVLKKAIKGHYLQYRIDGIPPKYLRKYCLEGTDEHEGTLLIDNKLRERVTFSQVNLNENIESLDCFDIIFLRNVLIYFDMETKSKIITQLTKRLHPGGYLFIGHSESLDGLNYGLKKVIPSIYHKI